MIENEKFKEKVKMIFDEEKPKGIEGYESLKTRCVEVANKMKNKKRRKRRKDRKK